MDDFCSQLDRCAVSSSYAARELVELAIDGCEGRIATTYSALTVEQVHDRLALCIDSGCPMHRHAEDALELLARIVEESAREDATFGPECPACSSFCGVCQS